MTPTDHLEGLATLSDAELFANVQRLTARSNVTLAALLAHLGEVEARGLHRTRACASLYTYCIYELRMSEDAAYRRSKAARLVREYPELGEAIAKGELHLTGLLMIGPHLGGERHAEILRRARFRSKREICRIVAELDPRPDVPALVSPIGPELPGHATHRAFIEALSGPYRELPFGRRPADWMEGHGDDGCGSDGVPGGDGGKSDGAPGGGAGTNDGETVDGETAEPARPLRYRVQFTATQELVDLLQEATDLLGHVHPRPSLPDIQLRALRALVKELRTSKRAATSRSQATAKGREGGTAVSGGAGRGATAPARAASGGSTAENGLADTASDAPARVTSTSDATNDAPARHSPRSPRDAPARSHSRHVPSPVRRAVWTRDGARCAYVDDRGKRCCETCGLQLHHRHAHALGGPPTLFNLELRCRAHNTLAAEEDFGREHMDWMRGVDGGGIHGRWPL